MPKGFYINFMFEIITFMQNYIKTKFTCQNAYQIIYVLTLSNVIFTQIFLKPQLFKVCNKSYKDLLYRMLRNCKPKLILWWRVLTGACFQAVVQYHFWAKIANFASQTQGNRTTATQFFIKFPLNFLKKSTNLQNTPM